MNKSDNVLEILISKKKIEDILKGVDKLNGLQNIEEILND